MEGIIPSAKQKIEDWADRSEEEWPMAIPRISKKVEKINFFTNEPDFVFSPKL